MTDQEAFEIVLNLAEQGVIRDDPDMEEERIRQEKAIQRIEYIAKTIR